MKIFSYLFKTRIYHWIPICQYSGFSDNKMCRQLRPSVQRFLQEWGQSLARFIYFDLAIDWSDFCQEGHVPFWFRACNVLHLQARKKKKHSPLYIWCCSIFLPWVENSYWDTSPLVAPFPSFKCSSKTMISWHFILGKEPKSLLAVKRSFPGICQWGLCKLAET